MNDEGRNVLLLRLRGAAGWRQGLASTPEVKAGEEAGRIRNHRRVVMDPTAAKQGGAVAGAVLQTMEDDNAA